MKLIVIGGVAAGASAAARARRKSESAEILVLDRGEHVSFANCGLPYFVGGVIPDEEDLLLAGPELFRDRFDIEVRTRSEVLSIDRAGRTISIRDLARDLVYEEPYDALILAPGARPVVPPFPGVDLPGVFRLRTIPDSKKIKAAAADARHATVIGGGFIGLEMAENLRRLGLDVTLLERNAQVLKPLDPEFGVRVARRMQDHGVDVRLSVAVQGVFQRNDGLLVELDDGPPLRTDLVLLAIGVRPESDLAAAAGLDLGPTGGIRVDAAMQTSDPAIWAAGDVVEVHSLLTNNHQLLPLAGPANRQGRIAGENAVGGRAREPVGFRGVQGTAIAEVFGLAVGATGASEKLLERRGDVPWGAVHLHPSHHVGYYPGARALSLKLLYALDDGRVLGAQAVGEAGVARRIDVLSMAIQLGGTVHDLAEAELAYAPQFGAAKDPVNLAGMIAVNNLRGDLPLAPWAELGSTDATLLDVRSRSEFAADGIAGAVNIPLEELRGRTDELPSGELWVVCGVGKRAYYATRLLRQIGVDARVLSGGMRTFAPLRAAGVLSEPGPAPRPTSPPAGPPRRSHGLGRRGSAP